MEKNQNQGAQKLRKSEIADLPVRLREWFSKKISEGENFEIHVKKPSDGYSGDTYIVDLGWHEGAVPTTKKFVVRAELGTTNNPESYYRNMVGLMRVLGAMPGLPVPEVLWVEDDESVLGGPFFVMAFVEGRPVPDIPPFVVAGWFAEASPGERKAVYRAGLEFLARLHAIDWRKADLGFLLHQGTRSTQTGNHLDYLIRIYDQALEGERPARISMVIEWLRSNIPEPENLVLSWGDCRAGNMLFQGVECVAALDWEMCSLADPAADIGWWINADNYFLGDNIPRLDGMPDRDEMVSMYEKMAGKPLENIGYFEVFSSFRMMVVNTHLLKIWLKAGQKLHGEGDSLSDHPFTRLLDRLVTRMGIIR